MDRDLQEMIGRFKSFLEYLKEMGIETLPASGSPAELPSRNLSVPSPRNLTLGEVRAELGDCRRCKLHRTRRNIVFGEGNPRARLMLIGEGPGFEEDVQGRPFVGKAGQLLTRILLAIQLQRQEVYIANIIKCRPPENRNPESEEIEACSPFLLKQVRAVRPQIICALGTFAAQTLLKTDAKITALRGRFYEREGVQVIPTFHPAFLLRNPDRKKEVWQDMKEISRWLLEHQDVGERGTEKS